MGFYSKRRRITPEEKAANAAAREQRHQAAMTCQICGRKILANLGYIAHHGYERPYEGWQTSSCYGAKVQPYEVSRLELGSYILHIKLMLSQKKEYRAKVVNEEVPLTVKWQERDPKNRYNKISKSLQVTRQTFDQVNAENESNITRHGWKDFQQVKKSSLSFIDAEISQIVMDIEHQEHRFNDWKQTHERKNDQWVKIAA